MHWGGGAYIRGGGLIVGGLRYKKRIYSTYLNHSLNIQALKYLLQGRLTKCPVTLSLGRTYVRRPSVQF